MLQGMKQLKIDDTIEFTDNISEADVLLALQSKLKKNSGLQAAAKSRGIPTYVSKTSSLAQITKAIQAVMSDYADGFEFYESEAKANDSEKIDALEVTCITNDYTIELLMIFVSSSARHGSLATSMLVKETTERKSVNEVCRLNQAEKLTWYQRVASEHGVWLRILPLQGIIDEDKFENEEADRASMGDFYGLNGETNGSAFTIDRLPLLPD
ncbi:UNVERIFIED_CONTAM: protein SEEDLING PLASTID DEVELOPMENT 1 [Sesamum radiatum]|uniref:Protein SEEDLING PLASTID DEVELOPMENT 1 n=1 Tax=Sesamum radiatum TaxID=300843 RepID=A0AAW2KKT0_SESRA